MNLEEQYHAEEMLRKIERVKEDAEVSGLMASAKNRLHLQAKKIGELHQQLANALAANEQNLKVYHAAAAELRQQLSERDKQNLALKDALIKWRQQAFPGTDQRRVIERDFPTEPKP